MPEPAMTTAAAKPTMSPLPKRRRRSEFLDVCDKKIENKKKEEGHRVPLLRCVTLQKTRQAGTTTTTRGTRVAASVGEKQTRTKDEKVCSFANCAAAVSLVVWVFFRKRTSGACVRELGCRNVSPRFFPGPARGLDVRQTSG